MAIVIAATMIVIADAIAMMISLKWNALLAARNSLAFAIAATKTMTTATAVAATTNNHTT